MCTQYCIAGTADEAWEQCGGGNFSFKIDRSGAPHARGWPRVARLCSRCTSAKVAGSQLYEDDCLQSCTSPWAAGLICPGQTEAVRAHAAFD